MIKGIVDGFQQSDCTGETTVDPMTSNHEVENSGVVPLIVQICFFSMNRGSIDMAPLERKCDEVYWIQATPVLSQSHGA